MSIQIDWQAFTPISLVGGLMLGVATVILLLGIGRIAGISGIFSSLLKPKRVEMWQVLFIAGNPYGEYYEKKRMGRMLNLASPVFKEKPNRFLVTTYSEFINNFKVWTIRGKETTI